jgi:chromosome segregation ATPase
MKGDIGGLQARERALENEVAEFKKHTRGLEELIEHLKHNLREVEERAEQLQNDNKSEINNLTSEIDRLVREIDSHQLQAGELDKAEATVQALKVDIDELKARERALELERDAARTALVAERAARRAAEEEGEALDRRHLELRNELIRIQALSEEILPRNRRLEDELNSARAVDRVVREELKAAQENEHAVRQALERVFSSRSWKMTSFPRRLITKLKSK